MDVKAERTQEDLRYLSVQENREPTPNREEVFPLNPSKGHQQREVTMPREDKNQNEKRNIETKMIRKKDRKLNKKKAKIEKLHEVLERTSQKEELQNSNLNGIEEQHRLALRHNEAI